MITNGVDQLNSVYLFQSNGQGKISSLSRIQGLGAVSTATADKKSEGGQSDFLTFLNNYKNDDKVDVQKLISKADSGPFAKPYHDYFDDAVKGVIEYNGVEIKCDYDHNALCIGDMGEGQNIFTVSLTHGKTLNVNRKNMDDIGKIMDMFNADDQKLIVNALLVDKMIQHAKFEMDELKTKTGLTMSKEN